MIVVGIGLAFITLIFEYWYYKNRDPEDRREDTRNQNFNSKVKQVTFGTICIAKHWNKLSRYVFGRIQFLN